MLARCPQCRGPLELETGGQARACPNCGRSVSGDDPLHGAVGAGYGIAEDHAVEGMRGWPATSAGSATLAGYAQREHTHVDPKEAGLPAAQVLIGPSFGERMGSYVVPQLPAGDDANPDARLLGTLARFIAYLKRNAILEDIEARLGHHMLHKHAYIAAGLGMRLGYDFDFLENGAFSADLEVDLFRLKGASGGTEPFAGNARASEAFQGLVREREAEWLQLATFAVRGRGREGALEEFLARPQGIIKYDRRMAEDAFAAVNRCMGEIAGDEP